jgi:uncharacterized protein with gpF-like domain
MPPRKRIGAPILPNAGNAAAYRKALECLIESMNRSLEYWLIARWRDRPPSLAMDEVLIGGRGWIGLLRRSMRELAKRWQSRFDEAAPKLAQHFAMRAEERSTKRLAAILADAGMTVNFRVTPRVRTAMGAAVTENVGLIRSIAAEHLTDVEGIVMRSAALGRDLETMATELRARFDVPKRRAALISRDQSNKMSAVITRVRQTEAGIVSAVWCHSHAGKTPRESHLAFSRGSLGGPIYDVQKGVILDGDVVWPGTAINCRCYSRPVLEGF